MHPVRPVVGENPELPHEFADGATRAAGHICSMKPRNDVLAPAPAPADAAKREDVTVANGRPTHAWPATRVMIALSHALAKNAIVGLIEAAGDLALVSDRAKAQVVVVDWDASPMTSGTDEAPPAAPAIVALTASTSPERITAALRAGVSSVVSTEAPPAELLRAIRTVAAGEMYFDPTITALLISQLRNRQKRLTGNDHRSRFAELSERERTVLRLVAQGHSGPEIGRLLGITAKTVDTYRHRIQEKIGLAHRTDYIHFALELGLLER